MKDSTQTAPLASQWCLVGNIVEERLYGEGSHKMRPGTKHFSGGTKIYCLPAQWGDGYKQIIAIGRHRGSKRFTTLIISSAWVTNWRAKVVYNPEVLRHIESAATKAFKRNWKSQEEVETYVKSMTASFPIAPQFGPNASPSSETSVKRTWWTRFFRADT